MQDVASEPIMHAQPRLEDGHDTIMAGDFCDNVDEVDDADLALIKTNWMRFYKMALNS